MQRKTPMKRGSFRKKARPAIRAAKRTNPLKVGALGKSSVPKGPLKDARHRKRVGMLRCLICEGARGIPYVGWPNEAHHIRECFPRTMGKRIGDDNTVPLCMSHHFALHRSSRTFWDAHAIEPIAIAAALYAETLALRNPGSKL